MDFSVMIFYKEHKLYLHTDKRLIKLLFFKNKVQEKDEYKFIKDFVTKNILEIDDFFIHSPQCYKDLQFSGTIAIELMDQNLIKQYVKEKGEL
jgi:hypothetical protein